MRRLDLGYKDRIFNNEQGDRLLDAVAQQNAILRVIASDKMATVTTDFKEIQRIVKTGNASAIFNIGDQINVPWRDVSGNQDYVMPFDIVHFGDVTLKDGTTVPGMWLQAHYTTPFDIQFGNAQAFYYAKEELPAGTYYITLTRDWGNNAKKGKSYQFTLSKPVPAGGQLRGFLRMPDTAPTTWKVYSHSSNTSAEAIETLDVTEGTEGTKLGDMQYDSAIDTSLTYPLNNMQRTAYGDNRWANSAYEQWLNSKAAAGAWWAPRDEYDVPPDQLSQKAGFMSGFGDDFLSIVQPVKVRTAKNTTCLDGSFDETYDTFFLPSLEQMYTQTQIAGEGNYWEYWKRALGKPSPNGWYDQNKNDGYKTYAINAKTSQRTVRVRSAHRGTACHPWCVYSPGVVSTNYAYWSYRCAPACVIC